MTNKITDLTWIAGGRDFSHAEQMKMALDMLPREREWLITGAAKGADIMAEKFWRNSGLPYVGIPARWRELGKRAGYVRNVEIAGWNPNRLLVLPGGRGTDMAIRLAEDMEIEVIYG